MCNLKYSQLDCALLNAFFFMTFSISSLLHSGFQHPVTRSWQRNECKLTNDSLVFPVFIHDLDDVMEEIPAMPGQYRYGIKTIKEVFTPLVENGLRTVLIFGVPTQITKDNLGSVSLFLVYWKGADDANGPVIKAIKVFRKEFPNLLVACDLCICPYTLSGHCGIFVDGKIDNLASIDRLAAIALEYAKAGAQSIYFLTKCKLSLPPI